MNNGHHFRSADVLVGIENIVEALEKFIDESKTTYDVCADSSIPSFIVKNGIIKKFFDFKKRNGHIRYITNVTTENIDYCKQIMKVAYIRHLEGLKAAFRVNESECHYNIVLDESRQMAIMLRSNLNEIVSQYQNVFDILWEKAIHIKERIREIESIGNLPSITHEEKIPSNTSEPYQTMLERSECQQENEPINKEIKLLLNSQIDDHNKKSPQQPPCVKIQLWSNASKSDYAIKLEARPDILAATKNTEGYTELVDESDYLEDHQYDWNYTLNHWIDINNLIRDVVSPLPKDTTKVTARKIPRQKLTLKCNYCKFIFNTEIRRAQHEQSWHSTTGQQK
jgi:hypothetical protein